MTAIVEELTIEANSAARLRRPDSTGRNRSVVGLRGASQTRGGFSWGISLWAGGVCHAV